MSHRRALGGDPWFDLGAPASVRRDLYTWTTPNGYKVSVLEECGLEYAVHPVNIREGKQFEPEFIAVSPNSKIPAIVDRDENRSIFESGAILVHLAEKTGKLLPERNPGRAKVLEWILWQMAASARWAVSSSTEVDESQSAASDGSRERKHSGWIRWAGLLRRVFAIDVLACARCGGRLRFVAAIDDPDVIRRILARPRTPNADHAAAARTSATRDGRAGVRLGVSGARGCSALPITRPGRPAAPAR